MLGESAHLVLDDEGIVKLEQARREVHMPLTGYHPEAATVIAAAPFWKAWFRKFFKKQ